MSEYRHRSWENESGCFCFILDRLQEQTDELIN